MQWHELWFTECVREGAPLFLLQWYWRVNLGAHTELGLIPGFFVFIVLRIKRRTLGLPGRFLCHWTMSLASQAIFKKRFWASLSFQSFPGWSDLELEDLLNSASLGVEITGMCHWTHFGDCFLHVWVVLEIKPRTFSLSYISSLSFYVFFFFNWLYRFVSFILEDLYMHIVYFGLSPSSS